MSKLEKGSSSEKCLLSKKAAHEIIVMEAITKINAKIDGILLCIRSVNGSALAMPPHEPHNKPFRFLRSQYSQKCKSFLLAQTKQEPPSVPFVHVPEPPQCLHSYKFAVMSVIVFSA